MSRKKRPKHLFSLHANQRIEERISESIPLQHRFEVLHNLPHLLRSQINKENFHFVLPNGKNRVWYGVSLYGSNFYILYSKNNNKIITFLDEEKFEHSHKVSKRIIYESLKKGNYGIFYQSDSLVVFKFPHAYYLPIERGVTDPVVLNLPPRKQIDELVHHHIHHRKKRKKKKEPVKVEPPAQKTESPPHNKDKREEETESSTPMSGINFPEIGKLRKTKRRKFYLNGDPIPQSS